MSLSFPSPTGPGQKHGTTARHPGKVETARRVLDYRLAEVKGSDERAAVRDKHRQAIDFLDRTIAVLAAHDASIFVACG